MLSAKFMLVEMMVTQHLSEPTYLHACTSEGTNIAYVEFYPDISLEYQIAHAKSYVRVLRFPSKTLIRTLLYRPRNSWNQKFS
uniref:Uncharacterized protein n=1 Tax=Arundo donax TaxID=35708 RepID=A0A0A9D2K2_ARUDO